MIALFRIGQAESGKKTVCVIFEGMQQQVQVVDETLKVFCPEFPVHDFPLIITWLVGKKNDHKRGITYASNSNFAFLLKEFFYLWYFRIMFGT